MLARQSQYFNMALTVKEVLDNNAAAIPYPPALEARRTALDDSLALIPEFRKKQGKDNTGIAAGKQKLKEEMALLARTVAGPLHVWAKDNKKVALAQEINFTKTDLLYTSASKAFTRCHLVYLRASAPGVDLTDYGILPATIAAVETATLAFGAAIGKPGAAKAAKVATTAALKKEIANLKKIIETMDNLMEPYNTTEKKFYDTYQVARRQKTTGVRHISIRGKVTHAVNGALITRGTVTCKAPGVDPKKVSISALGNYRIFSRQPGSYTLTIESPGYETREISNIAVFHAKLITIDVEMEET